MELKQALGQGAFFLMNKRLGLKYTWDATSVLCAIIDADDVFKTEDGWVYQTEAKIQELTGISGNRQDKFLKIFMEAGFLEKKVMGLPAKRYFKLNTALILSEALGLSEHDFSKLLSPKRGQPVSPKQGDLNAKNGETYNNKKYNDKECSNKDKAQSQSQAIDVPPTKKRNSVDWDWTDRIVERFGVTEEVAKDFIDVRKRDSWKISDKTFNDFCREVKKINEAGFYLAEKDAFVWWVKKEWRGFDADWYLKAQNWGAKTGYKTKETIEECMSRLSTSESARAELDVTPSKNGLCLPFFDDFDSDDPFAYHQKNSA